MTGNPLELFGKFFGAVRAIFWFCEPFLAPERKNVETSTNMSTLRAKGATTSQPRLSTPCEMRFFPREKGKMAFVEGFSLKRPFSLSRVGKIASRRG